MSKNLVEPKEVFDIAERLSVLIADEIQRVGRKDEVFAALFITLARMSNQSPMAAYVIQLMGRMLSRGVSSEFLEQSLFSYFNKENLE